MPLASIQLCCLWHLYPTKGFLLSVAGDVNAGCPIRQEEWQQRNYQLEGWEKPADTPGPKKPAHQAH